MAYKFNPLTGNLDEYGPILTGTGTVSAAADGTAALPGIAFTNDLNTGIYRPGADQLALSTNGTGRLFVDATGKIGIATASTSLLGQLQIQSATGQTTQILLNNIGDTTGDESRLEFKLSSSGALAATGRISGIRMGAGGLTDLAFSTFNASSLLERLRITSAGLVGIGNSAPGDTLDVRAANGAGITVGRINPTGTNSEPGYFRVRGPNASSVDKTWMEILPIIADATNNSEDASIVFRNIKGGSSTESARIDSSGTFRVKGAGTAGVNDAVQLNGSAPANSLLLDASGRLLVGTSSSVTEVPPAEITVPPLQVSSIYGASLALFRNDTSIFANNAIGGVHWYGNHTTSNIPADIAGIQCYADANHAAGSNPTRLEFSTTADGASSPTERMRIGNAGITDLFTSTSELLNLRSASAAGTTDYLIRGRYSATNTQSGTNSFNVFTNGNVTNTNNSYLGISDIKLKENIVDASSQWDDIKALQVRNYNFKEGQTHTQIGLVAQEVELVSPGLVSESPDRDEEGNDLGTVTKSVNYSVLYMKAVKALQEAMERIETLEAKVAALEAS